MIGYGDIGRVSGLIDQLIKHRDQALEADRSGSQDAGLPHWRKVHDLAAEIAAAFDD